MVFDYAVQKTFNQSIDVVDIGNTALRCTNRHMLDYYIIIKTVMGKVSILKFGPICPDLDVLEDDFSVAYKKIDYKENTICKEIDKFINDYKKEVDTIVELTEYEAWQAFPPIQQYFENV
jgi:hypothetical protein